MTHDAMTSRDSPAHAERALDNRDPRALEGAPIGASRAVLTTAAYCRTHTGDTGPMAKHALPDLVRPPVWDIEDGHDYLTLRVWDVALPPLVVVGMNPGKPQTTTSYVGQYIQRATLIAVRFGFGGFTLVNHWTIAESD